MESMTPSEEVTSEQIVKITDKLGSKIRAAKFSREAVQEVIIDPDDALTEELFIVVRKHVEARSGIIVRRVKVDRKLSHQQHLDATGRSQLTNKIVVKDMPSGKDNEVDVYFFPLKRNTSDEEVEQEFKLRGLIADPDAQCRVNAVDPSFADEHPNGCHWKDKDGSWCYLAFRRWGNDRNVLVNHIDDGWSGDWWFAGVRGEFISH